MWSETSQPEIEVTDSRDIYETNYEENISRPEKQTPSTRNPTTIIQFKALTKRVEKVKEALGASSNREVGEMTFQYFYDLECVDE